MLSSFEEKTEEEMSNDMRRLFVEEEASTKN